MPNCYFHSRKEAIHRCRQCHRDVCESCTIEVEGEPFCQICWDGQIAHLRNPHVEDEEKRREIPWQRWRELGPVKAFFDTAGQVVFRPAFFFSHLPAGRDLATPLLFALVCILLFWFPMNVIYIKWVFPTMMYNLPVQETSLEENDGQSSSGLPQGLRDRIGSLSGMDILTMPFNFFAFNIFIASLLQQVLISFFQGREGYIATFQIRCYATIAQCFLLIPFVGILLAEIGSLLVCLRGFQVVQKLTFAQALCVALVPITISFLAIPALL